MKQQDPIPHLFRTEFSRISAVLCRSLGIEYLQLAEDIAGDTFLTALETWPYKGVPENPSAWLYTVAKNKAKNHLQRQSIYANTVSRQIRAISPVEVEFDLSEKNITDSQLRMLFVLCDPCISKEAQVCLSLRILCGFGINEIATAFLTSKETINKRLQRAKEKLREQKLNIDLPPDPELTQRLPAVLTTLYLLFNEGYYSESNDVLIREELCLEAMRLATLLLEDERTARTPVYALLSLMCFHASRFPARKDKNGEMVLYDDQDETLWDQELITRGAIYLQKASQGNFVSKYHIEAQIAYWLTVKTDHPEKWQNLLQLYNHLLLMEYSPVAALNRTYAYSKVYGKEKAIIEAKKLEQLNNNPYYFALLGELYSDTDITGAIHHLGTAMSLARTRSDRQTLEKKINSLRETGNA